MARAKKKTNKANKPKGKRVYGTPPKPLEEEIATPKSGVEEIDKIPIEARIVEDPQPPKIDFKFNKDLDPANPNDAEAILAEAEAYREQVQKPLLEEEEKEAKQQFDTIIKTESDFLKHFEEKDTSSFQVVHDGALLTFNIRQIEPGDDLSDLNVDADLFADIDADTRAAILKQTKGEDLSDHERKLISKIDMGKATEMQEASLKMSHAILTQFVTPPAFEEIEDKTTRAAKRLAFWKKQPLTFKIFLSNEVSQRLGIDMTTRFSIFQPSGDGRRGNNRQDKQRPANETA
jgi:hypothetical protein